MSWTGGYVSDTRYPPFFYKEMQPLWLATVARLLGMTAPDVRAPFSLCELGCGQGANLLVAAACHPEARFVGVDFDPAHIEAARDAAAASGLYNLEFVQADFASFASRNQERFDLVTCHGVWSWVAPDERARLLGIAAQALLPGGLLYLHYMCHPGSTELVPLQHLLNLCAHHMPGTSVRKARTGMLLLDQMVEQGAFADRPALRRHLANMARREPADLAHEFLSDHWQPQHSTDLHQQVGATGLAYIGSADVFNNLDVSLSVPARLQPLIRRTAVPALAEALKDIARNAHQRQDLFQKGPRPLVTDVALAATRFAALPGAPRHGPVTFDTPIGPITGPEAVFTPLLERLASGPASGAELSDLTVFARDPQQLHRALQLLMMQQLAHPAMDPAPLAAARAEALGRWFADHGVGLRLVADCATALPSSQPPLRTAG
jgi:SAM-dependent methyltransferase